MKCNKYLISMNYILMWILLISIFSSVFGCAKNAENKKIYNVGIVSGAEAFVSIADGFKKKMDELGYHDGGNIFYDLKKFDTDHSKNKYIFDRFIKDKVDLILAFPTDPALAAKAAIRNTDIAVVFALSGIEGNNLIESIPKPGGNITGVRFPGLGNTSKRLDIMHELVPNAKRILLLYDSNYPYSESALAQLYPAAKSMSLTLVEDPVISVEEIQAHLKARSASQNIGVDAIFIMPEILTQTPEGFSAIAKFAKEHKLPIGGAMPFTVDSGALFSFAPDNIEMGGQAAVLADKIFKGAPAGSLMVVTPTNYLRLNYKVIQEMGLTVSESLMGRAKEIIH